MINPENTGSGEDSTQATTFLTFTFIDYSRGISCLQNKMGAGVGR